MDYKLTSEFTPTGDQPQAIERLVAGINHHEKAQTLLGVTGSGKTFTMANVITQLNRPTLILAHNKTLAAQLYGEFKQFFPENAVEYFISYYDYYQPEAYISTTDTYIEKDLSINDEIEKLRLHTTSSLMSGRRDVIVIASVSCIYGMGNPEEYANMVIPIKIGDRIPIAPFLTSLVEILYQRTEVEFTRGSFRVKGDTVDIFPAYADFAYRILFWDDDIDQIQRIDPISGACIAKESAITIFPANLFVTGKETLNRSIRQIQDDMMKQIQLFEHEGRLLEAKRIKERTEFDLEMMRELGYCTGIENYSRYFDARKPGSRPFCLLDYFPNDYLIMVDESHVTIPQIKAMWGGDRSRKVALVDHGFRLPSAMDNRPLKFEEFESLVHQIIYVSATPADYELRASEGVIVEQIIRPTGLLDPMIEVRPTLNQIDDLLHEIDSTLKSDYRVLITTLTKRMAEELTKYLENLNIKTRYIHSEVKSLERVEILRELRLGIFDVLVGVNLLREGLDLPEVALVAIMDADKEGFLRNTKSLIQTIGRAARNTEGKVLMYADKTTNSMEVAIQETQRRRKLQHAYNQKHGITPKTIQKSTDEIMAQTQASDAYTKGEKNYTKPEKINSTIIYADKTTLKKEIKNLKKQMEQAARDLDFITAAKLRDEMIELENLMKSKF